MKRIIIHWTGGIWKPNEHERECYHYLIDATGKKHEGIFKPEDNENCYDGKYAQHTGGGNTGAIGIGLCGMCGFVNSDSVGNYPLTKVQVERCFKLVAELAKKYNIPINPNTVMTHYEFGLKNPQTSSKGKIDIIYLPPYPSLKRDEIGNFIRSKVKWYFSKN